MCALSLSELSEATLRQLGLPSIAANDDDGADTDFSLLATAAETPS